MILTKKANIVALTYCSNSQIMTQQALGSTSKSVLVTLFKYRLIYRPYLITK